MSELLTSPPKPATPPTILACRLRHRPLPRGQSLTSGEVEIENQSGDVLEFEVRSSPLQFLDLIVTDDAGKVVSSGYYGDLFSPSADGFTLRLQPGEKFSAPISLLGNVRFDRQKPGEYKVVAVFQYRGLRAVSEPIQLTVGAAS
jgi:hypothetical protein